MTGYAGRVAPPFERMYTGGDSDIRGFDIRAISPIAFSHQPCRCPAAKSGRHSSSPGSGESATRKRPGAYPGTAVDLSGWRHVAGVEHRISHSHRRTSDAGRFRGHGLELHICGNRNSVLPMPRLPISTRHCSVAPAIRPAGCAPGQAITVSQRCEACGLYKLCSAHVHRPGTAGHHANTECTFPLLLRL